MAQVEAYRRARDAAQKGLQLDDSLAELHVSLASVHRFLDWDWPAAERRLLRALELNPGYATGRRWYAQFLSGMGRAELATLYARVGRIEEARAMMEHLQKPVGGGHEPYVEHRISPFGMATFHAVVGEHGQALDWPERAYAERDGTLVWIKVHPRLDPLRGEPRFRELLARMKLDS